MCCHSAAAVLLRGHAEDVIDLTWAPDGSALASGSLDNACMVWDAASGKAKLRLDQHTHYVQGVSWDPLGTYLLTMSSDRTCRQA